MKVVRKSSELTRPNSLHGFVPTMGALHEGHLSLIRAAKRECPFVTVSIFVNPLQFAPSDDFQKYPRNEEQDIKLCESVNADCVFLPGPEFLGGRAAAIHVGLVSELFEGQKRPGHFDGVATIVAKLFNAVMPNAAYFGLKDRQQCAVVRAMTRDLSYPLEIRALPTIREPDGLAMSSRNTYLSNHERSLAPELFRTLTWCRDGLVENRSGAVAGGLLEDSALRLTKAGFEVEYFDLVDEGTFTPTLEIGPSSVLIVAARLGKTRLIDNLSIFGS